MDYDTFLSSQRWAILEIISVKPSSPVEISEKIGTSVSYVSQQLKLLEAAGMVTKLRTGSADKGKPRLVYSIVREVLQITALVKQYPIKKHVSLDDYKKATLRIWSLDNEHLHYSIEKLFWKLDDDLKNIRGIYYDSAGKEILIVSDSKKIKSSLHAFSEVPFHIVSDQELKRKKNLYTIHGPTILDEQILKGGDV